VLFPIRCVYLQAFTGNVLFPIRCVYLQAFACILTCYMYVCDGSLFFKCEHTTPAVQSWLYVCKFIFLCVFISCQPRLSIAQFLKSNLCQPRLSIAQFLKSNLCQSRLSIAQFLKSNLCQPMAIVIGNTWKKGSRQKGLVWLFAVLWKCCHGCATTRHILIWCTYPYGANSNMVHIPTWCKFQYGTHSIMAHIPYGAHFNMATTAACRLPHVEPLSAIWSLHCLPTSLHCSSRLFTCLPFSLRCQPQRVGRCTLML
jgi:hypothetical protein